MILLSAINITKIYGSKDREFRAVNNVNLDVEKGEFIVIMGSSGSGKSSLLYLLSGLDSVSSGSVTFSGELLSGMSDNDKAKFRRRHVGFVFQDHALMPDLTLWQNIVTPGYLENPVREVNDYAKSLVKDMNIHEHVDKYPSQVSGGQLQRASIARALINKPDIIFCDEPTGNLDSNNKKAVLDILLKLNNMKQTIIMVTHDTGDALYGSRIIYLKDGGIADSISLSEYPMQNAGRKQKMQEFLGANGWLV